MIQTYKFDDTTLLLPHFNAKEFLCKCGKEHDFQISDEQIANLEKFYEAFNCFNIAFTYRRFIKV